MTAITEADVTIALLLAVFMIRLNPTKNDI